MQSRSFTTLSLALIITIIFHYPSKFVSAIDERYQNCSGTFDCGNITGISYPFWGSARPNYCGQPDFWLDCTEETAVITITNLTYQVLDIYSESRTLKVARTDYIGGICPNLLHNTTLNSASFNYSSGIRNITLYYDCPARSTAITTPQGFSSQFTCTVNDSDSNGFYVTRRLSGYDNAIISFLVSCKNHVTVPATESAVLPIEISPTEENLIAALEEGFGLQWTANDSTCATCKLSGGICGYNYTTSSFACYCSDQAQPFSCGTTNQQESGDKSNIAVKLGIGTIKFCYEHTRLSRNKISYTVENLRNLFAISGLGTAVSVAAIFSICYCIIRRGFWSKTKNTKQEKDIEAFIMNYHSLMPQRYSYSDIKKITNSFADKLGQGGFGSVYRGKLKDGRCVAVKVLNKSIGEGEEFINEVASISRTSHVNIVTLLGFCYERTKRALIYEYMPNGSLDKFIYDLGNQLERKMLYDIAIGIARGLEYLHQRCNTRIVHFDIKPQNVLLDDDFCPKISDFGLAKLCKRKESIVSMLSARGTVGYIAPEVFMRSLGGASYKSDVYSYGMMILEMFGRRNTSDIKASEGSEMYFPDELYNYLEAGENSSMNENVIEGDEGEMVRRMIIIGLWCIQTNPSDRPSMTKVIEMLEGSLQSLQIPPKPLFFATTPTVEVEYSSTLSSAADMIPEA
ncbi:hypothetical protein JCGZ_13032 [Jatropha curcas]|uniref:non-specific serine/threonine protein kinase n=1 Tax=Jatropha curcas TaxID=180498 RepID=A0A067K9S7_JATCU|nr:hypothetical protein JCGZ_13032 [Jatropha curcas]